MSDLHPIQSYRAQRGLSRQEFGDLVGVSRNTVRRWELGERRVDVDVLNSLVTLTGIPPRELRPDLARLFDGGAP